MTQTIKLRTLSDPDQSSQQAESNNGERIANARRGYEASFMPSELRAYVNSPDQSITKSNHQAMSRDEWNVIRFLVKDKWSDDEIIQHAKEKRFSYYTSHAKRNPHDPEGDLKRKIESVRAFWESKGQATSTAGGVFRVLDPKQLSPQRVIDDGVVCGQSQAQFVRDCRARYGCSRQTPYNLLKRGERAGMLQVTKEGCVVSFKAAV